MQVIKQYQIVIAAVIIGLSIVWHGQNIRYEFKQISSVDFVKFDKRNATVEFCKLDPKNCYSWDYYRLTEKDDKEKHYNDYLQKRMKEEGLTD